MHAYFGQLKARCACFLSKINLSSLAHGKVYQFALMKKTFIATHCFDRPQVCCFGNSGFITER